MGFEVSAFTFIYIFMCFSFGSFIVSCLNWPVLSTLENSFRILKFVENDVTGSRTCRELSYINKRFCLVFGSHKVARCISTCSIFTLWPKFLSNEYWVLVWFSKKMFCLFLNWFYCLSISSTLSFNFVREQLSVCCRLNSGFRFSPFHSCISLFASNCILQNSF